MSLRKLTNEEKSILVARIEESYKNPTAIEELRQAGERLQKQLGRTGNYQYDDFVKRAEYSRWWNEIKDIPVTI